MGVVCSSGSYLMHTSGSGYTVTLSRVNGWERCHGGAGVRAEEGEDGLREEAWPGGSHDPKLNLWSCGCIASRETHQVIPGAQ